MSQRSSDTALSFRFRQLRSSDAPRLFAIESKVYQEPWSEELLRASIKAPNGHGFGLFEQTHTCIGYAIFQIAHCEAHLLNLAIAKEYQRKGWGTYLLDRCLDELIDNGVESCFLEVRPSNTGARKLYENKGFHGLMTREQYYGDGEEALIMLKRLKPLTKEF